MACDAKKPMALVQQQSKYINAEAHAINPYERVEYAITKAVPKVVDNRPNLGVVVDDLFFSPLESPKDCLEFDFQVDINVLNLRRNAKRERFRSGCHFANAQCRRKGFE
jgi:hypothetical protein